MFISLMLANFLLMRIFSPGPQVGKVPYTVFRTEVAKGNVETVYSRGESITGRFRAPIVFPAALDSLERASQDTITEFETTLPAFVDPGLETLLIDHGVEISAKPIQERNPWLNLLYSFAPGLMLMGFYVWMLRRAAKQGGAGGMGGVFSMGKSNARRFNTETEPKVTFDDVAGIDEAENELVEIVDFLRDPRKYTRLGGVSPKGVLMVG
jgi:cell division protease FtsH